MWRATHLWGREKRPVVRICYPCCHVVSGICVLSLVSPRASVFVCAVRSLHPPSPYLITSVSLGFSPLVESLSIDCKVVLLLECGFVLEFVLALILTAHRATVSLFRCRKNPITGIIRSDEKPWFTCFSSCLLSTVARHARGHLLLTFGLRHSCFLWPFTHEYNQSD